MGRIYVEENAAYSIDCRAAIWATDRIHEDYHEAGLHINDVDFVIENDSYLFLLEYKNANIANAVKPEAFNPMGDKKIFQVTRKFYDSLHYLRLLDKSKPIQYVYVLEYPNGDQTSRKRLRNKLKMELPFELQKKIGNGRKLIDKVDVVSIKEWNEDESYGKYPILPIKNKIESEV